VERRVAGRERGATLSAPGLEETGQAQAGLRALTGCGSPTSPADARKLAYWYFVDRGGAGWYDTGRRRTAMTARRPVTAAPGPLETYGQQFDVLFGKSNQTLNARYTR
jgi:hypothetical protein